MGITMIVTGRLGKPERPSFLSRRAHLLTTGPQASGGIPPFGRVVRSSRSIHRMLRQRGADNATEPAGVGRHCLYGWQIGFRPVCSFAANCCPLSGQPAIRLRKPATGSFLAAMDDALPAPSIFFCLAKRNKTAPCRGQKGRE